MQLYITHLVKTNGTRLEGPIILAENFEAAELIVDDFDLPEGFIGIVVIGEYISECDFDAEHDERYH